MSFASLLTDTKSQIEAVIAAPIPFVLVAAMLAAAIYRIVSWHLGGRINSLEEQVKTLDGRLKLRDDEITHLKRLAEIAADERSHDTAAMALDGGTGPALPASLPVVAERDFSMPWRVVIPPEEREFADYDALIALLDSLQEATSARRAALVRPFIRKWIHVEAVVIDVDVRDEETCVSSTLPNERHSFLWIHFTRDRDSLAHLIHGDTIALIGWIEDVTRSSIRLYGCERSI